MTTSHTKKLRALGRCAIVLGVLLQVASATSWLASMQQPAPPGQSILLLIAGLMALRESARG